MPAKVRLSCLAVLIALGAAAATPATAKAPPLSNATIVATDTRRDVDLVIALDVSGSMEGLIDSAKQRLWDITNELARARPTPNLRVAILSYGQPSYGASTGFVRLDLPFTSDLDSVSETLFAFRTNGGDEYVSRAIQTSLDKLKWSQDSNALKILFVAGNESAEQDPQISIANATSAAARRGIVVNAIYCGANGDADSRAWQRLATNTNGMYASIDQNAAAVANVATPFDAPLAGLNHQLNDTYIAMGSAGKRAQEKLVQQDRNAAAMSPAAAASRTVTKGGALYRAEGDLVDVVKSGKPLATIPVSELPAELQALPAAERETYVREKAEQRANLQRQIGKLATERSQYIEAQKRDQASAARGREAKGLDAAILDGIRKVAATKGFTFETK